MILKKYNINISVIIPVFNRQTSILSCLNSVINQTYSPKEIIIIDDYSTDKTTEIIESINSPLIHLVKLNKNIGAQAARNIGIKKAKCEWIAFLDSDDTWVNNKLDRQVAILLKNKKHHPWIVIQSNCNKVSNGVKTFWKINTYTQNNFFNKLLTQPGPMFQGMITTKQALEKINLLDENIVSYQEWDTSISLSQLCIFLWDDSPLFNYRIDSTDSSFKSMDKRLNGYIQIINKNKQKIITVHGEKKYSHEITNQIIFAYKNNSSSLGKMIFKKNKKDISTIHLLKIITIYYFKVPPKTFTFLEFLKKSPISGIKHIIKILLKSSKIL